MADLPAVAAVLEPVLSRQDVLVGAVCQRDVALLLVVQNIDGVGDLGRVEPTLHQLELLLLEGARHLHLLLRGQTPSAHLHVYHHLPPDI